MADEVNKVSLKDSAFEDHKVRVLRRMQTLNGETAGVFAPSFFVRSFSFLLVFLPPVFLFLCLTSWYVLVLPFLVFSSICSPECFCFWDLPFPVNCNISNAVELHTTLLRWKKHESGGRKQIFIEKVIWNVVTINVVLPDQKNKKNTHVSHFGGSCRTNYFVNNFFSKKEKNAKKTPSVSDDIDANRAASHLTKRVDVSAPPTPLD